MDEEMWGDGDVEKKERVIELPKNIVKSAKELKVFQRSYKFSLILHKTSLTFPKIEQFALADQLRRCSKSVCSNIFEGFAKQSSSKTEFKRFLTIAIDSANETELWINYAFDLGYITEQIFHDWLSENDVVVSMLVNLRNKL